jgi:CBS domain-containing protein
MIVTGATPLKALDAMAFDTETTGLDAAKDRVVQMGAVPISAGVVDAAAVWQTLVDPRIPIPASATAIHRITNAMVRNAPSFAQAWRGFDSFAAGRILIGHSIGFDLAVMAKEAARAGLDWKKPRSLCMRLLAATANPRLPDYSLEAIASWLGVAIGDRHQAAGDARAAADIFVALVPHLAERGIRTLAEAERACLGLTAQLEDHHRVGWVEPVSRPEGFRSFVAVDPYAYRHRLSDLMSSPPVVTRSDASVRDTMQMMLSRRISSVFVSDNGKPGGPLAEYGIVTERDMMRHLAAGGEGAFSAPVGGLASRPLVSIRAAAFAYRAIGRMDRLKIRHLAVRDEDNRLAGVVSARDLLKLRASAAINLSDAIEVASSADALAAAWARIPSVAQSLIAEDIDAPVIAEIVSEELRAMTRRAAILAELEMATEGRGAPPCPYTVLVLGSGGRGESLLAADQDNAILFADGEPDGPQDRWFAALGEKIATALDRAGIPLCKGGVMARNAAWRGSLDTWSSRVSDWVRRSRPADLLNVDIFYDMRPVHGDHGLAAALHAHAFDAARGHITFAKGLGEHAAAPADPFTLFGGFRLDDGRIDLKFYGLFPVVAFARALAIRHDVRARSTRERLAGLISMDIGPDAEMTRLTSAHARVLKFMLRQQSRDLLAGIPVSNRVGTAALSRDEQAELRSALKAIGVVPDLVRDLMF